MERIYAPWRTQYVASGEKENTCVFCDISKNLDDEKMNVLFYDKYCFVVMNKYPYGPGHIMVIPHFHTDNLEELDEKIWERVSIRVKQGAKMLREVMNAHGVNLGMNLGAMAGAGIPEHIHYHILPRYSGDTNFITTIGEVRVYPVEFDKVYKKLKAKASEYFTNI